MTMADLSFLQGLFTGVATGTAQNLVTERQRVLDDERRQAEIAGRLLAGGDFETLLAIDPKIRKKIGLTPELESTFGVLANRQREMRETEARGTKARTQQAEIGAQRAAREEGEIAALPESPIKTQARAASAQAKTAEAQAAVAGQKQTALAGATPQQQQDVLLPEIGQAEATRKRLELEQQRVAAEAVERSARIAQLGEQLKLTRLQVDEAQQLANETERMRESDPEGYRLARQSKLYPNLVPMQKSLLELKEAERRNAVFDKLPPEVQKIVLYPELARMDAAEQVVYNKFIIAEEAASRTVNAVFNNARRVRDGVREYTTYNTKEEAETAAHLANEGVNRVNSIRAQRNAVSGKNDAPMPLFEAVPIAATGIRGLVNAKDGYEVRAVAKQAEAPVNPFTQKLEQRFLSKEPATAEPQPPQPSGGAGGAVRFQIPNNRSGVVRMQKAVSEAASVAQGPTGGRGRGTTAGKPEEAVRILISAGIDEATARNIVDNNLFNALEQSLETTIRTLPRR